MVRGKRTCSDNILWLSHHLFNKMPVLAFMRDAVPDLLPLYASQIF